MSADKQYKLVGGLYNSHRTPSWDDKIYLYSHGNASWLGNILDGELIKLLSTHGSVFVYDYRGYGCNDGYPTDIGLENDALGAWNFITKRVNPANIIVVGHSLGSGVSCRLLANLTKNKPDSLPRHLILNAPFSSIKDMARHTVPPLAWLSIYEFDNLNNAKLFDNKVKICVFHSKLDEVIPYSQSEKLADHLNCNFIEIHGKHGDQHFSREALEYVHKISKY
jgi:predicted alpha/beta hydrolase family esterase